MTLRVEYVREKYAYWFADKPRAEAEFDAWLAAHDSALLADRDRLAAQVEAVKALHTVRDSGFFGADECSHCSDIITEGDRFAPVSEPSPCPTIRALEGES